MLEKALGERLLRVGGLGPGRRGLAIACLITVAAAGALILMTGFAVGVPGGADDVAFAGEVPLLLTAFSYVGLAVGTATAASAATSWGWRGRVLLLFVAVCGAVIAAKTVEARSFLTTYRQLIDGRDLLPAWVPSFVGVCGWSGLGAAIVVGVTPTGSVRRLDQLRPILAATPFLLALAAWLAVAVTAEYPAVVAAELPHPRAVIAGSVIALIYGIAFWSSGLLLWQAAMAARAARDLGAKIASSLTRWRFAVVVLLGAKLLWLTLGLAGVLPGMLGGAGQRWEASRSDGLASWLFASFLAMAGGIWLCMRGNRPIRDSGLNRAVAAVVGGFLLMLLLAAAGLFGIGILGVAPGSRGQDFFRSVAEWAGDQILLSQALTVFAGFAIGIVLWRRHLAPAGAAFLLLFGIWALPRAVGITINELSPDSVAIPRVETVTLDVAITVAIAAVVLLTSFGLVRPGQESTLVLVVLAFAFIAHTGWLLESLVGDKAFYLGLVFPVLYQFVFSAEGLNREHEERPRRILQAVGLSAVLMTIVAVQVDLGAVAPEKPSFGALGHLLLAVPLTAVLIATQLRRGRPRSPNYRRSSLASE
jgi:hypothetical protein